MSRRIPQQVSGHMSGGVQAGAESGNEGFEKFNDLRTFLEKAESSTASIFIQVLL